MNNLKDIITERLHITKDTKVNKPTEEVLVLERANGYDTKLFLNGLNNMYNSTHINDLLVMVDFSYFTLPKKGSLVLNDKIKYYSIGNPEDVRIKLNKRNCAEIVTNEVSVSSQFSNIDIIDTLIDTLHRWNAKSFDFNRGTKLYYLYLWVSQNDQVIKILMSNKEYKELKNKDTFI